MHRSASLVVLVGKKGRGSNMIALAKACDDPQFPARIAAVVSPVDDSPAVENARSLGLNVVVLDPDAPDYADDLLTVTHQADAALLCLAGFTRMLPEKVVHAYPLRILNVHPALLPKFGGKGMYGMNVHKAVLASGDHESGCTVHFVTEQYDEGPIILQLKCPVEEGDSPETLAARVLEKEHIAYPAAVEKVLATL